MELMTAKTMELLMKPMTDVQITPLAHRVILNVKKPISVLNLTGSVMVTMTVAIIVMKIPFIVLKQHVHKIVSGNIHLS